ncbi:HIT family protein [Candidatus Woesearchaeota archaeon]|nr:HIT family protein [Candidatus Woesearchaeota archaeon]
MNDCIFCKIVKKEIPADIIYEDDKTIVFLDIAPVHPGHSLVVPKEHHATLTDTPTELACYMMEVVKKTAPAIMKAVSAEGFNLGVNTEKAAGQIVFHTHYHIIPRFTNDGLKHWPQQKYQEGQMKTVAERIRKEL